jgi:carbon storage regulator
MLVLSRSVGERILVGDGVVITVLAIQGRVVRLGVEAPEAVVIPGSSWSKQWGAR